MGSTWSVKRPLSKKSYENWLKYASPIIGWSETKTKQSITEPNWFVSIIYTFRIRLWQKSIGNKANWSIFLLSKPLTYTISPDVSSNLSALWHQIIKFESQQLCSLGRVNRFLQIKIRMVGEERWGEGDEERERDMRKTREEIRNE